MKEASVATATRFRVKPSLITTSPIPMRRWVRERVRRAGMCDCEARQPLRVAIGNSILDAYDRAYKTDPTPHSAALSPLTASWMRKPHRHHFSSVRRSDYCAVRQRRSPKITAAKQNVRVLTCGQWGELFRALISNA